MNAAPTLPQQTDRCSAAAQRPLYEKASMAAAAARSSSSSKAAASSSSSSSSGAAPPPPMWAPPPKSSTEVEAARALYAQRAKDIAAKQAVTERGVPIGSLFEVTARRKQQLAERSQEQIAADRARVDSLIASRTSPADKAYHDAVTCEREGCRRDPFNSVERTSEEGTGAFCCRTCQKGLMKKGKFKHGPVCNEQWNNSDRFVSEWEYERAQGLHD